MKHGKRNIRDQEPDGLISDRTESQEENIAEIHRRFESHKVPIRFGLVLVGALPLGCDGKRQYGASGSCLYLKGNRKDFDVAG